MEIMNVILLVIIVWVSVLLGFVFGATTTKGDKNK